MNSRSSYTDLPPMANSRDSRFWTIYEFKNKVRVANKAVLYKPPLEDQKAGVSSSSGSGRESFVDAVSKHLLGARKPDATFWTTKKTSLLMKTVGSESKVEVMAFFQKNGPVRVTKPFNAKATIGKFDVSRRVKLDG